MQIDPQTFVQLQAAVATLSQGFTHMPETGDDTDWEKIAAVLQTTAQKMQDNFPYYHPLYAGQMLKPPHPIAKLAYMMAMWVNPNNHALDGSIAGSQMEKEAVAQLAQMIGWQTHLGHLCGGGTIANLEALWVAGNIHPNLWVVGSAQAHYTHARISDVLGITFRKVESNEAGQMDLTDLRRYLQTGNVGTVVVTMGTTGTGSVDDLAAIVQLQTEYGFRIHVDAAYGGYFTLTDTLPPDTQRKFAHIDKADSLVIDPHKHGLQPYGCGCVLFRDPSVGVLYQHDSPYTYFSSAELHLGEISLECSRPGAAAVALWATLQHFPLTKGGEFALNLQKSLSAAQKLYQHLDKNPLYLPLMPPELDIVAWGLKAPRISEMSALAQKAFAACAQQHLHLALFQYPVDKLSVEWSSVEKDRPFVTLLRSCLMKPEHEDWVEKIAAIIDDVSLSLVK